MCPWKKIGTIDTVSHNAYPLQHTEHWVISTKAVSFKRRYANIFWLFLYPVKKVDKYAFSALNLKTYLRSESPNDFGEVLAIDMDVFFIFQNIIGYI